MSTGNEFVALSVSSLKLDEALGFDLYQLDEGQYRLYKRSAVPLTRDDLSKLHEIGRTTLYISSSQKSAFYQKMRGNIANLLRDPVLPISEKMDLLTETSAEILADALGEPESSDNLKAVCRQCEHHVDVALLGDDSRKSMTSYRANKPYPLAHALAVGNLSILLAIACGYDDPDQLNAIGAGGLLHEIGKVVLDKHYYTRLAAGTHMTHNRLLKYPEVGRQLLQKSSAHELAQRCTAEHQERLDGAGFPNHLKSDQICREARIVAICDAFDEQTNPLSPTKPVSPFVALRRMKDDSGRFDREALYTFIRMLGGIDNPAPTSELSSPANATVGT